MDVDYYRTLDVDPQATAAELRTAYLKLARAHHPDQFDGPQREVAQERMQAINQAWNVIGTPHKRREYDHGRPEPSTSMPGAQGPVRGHAHFEPFDDDPINREDVDLDPTPLAGSRSVPRWVAMTPVVLFAWSVLLMVFGLLMNAAAIVAFAVVVFLLAGCGFLMMPLIVMSRAEKDPGL